MKTKIKFLCLFMLAVFNAPAATEKIIIDKINGNSNYARPSGLGDVSYTATNGNWNANNFYDQIPVIAGSTYDLVIIGDWLDTWNNLEIVVADGKGKTSFGSVTVSNIVKSSVGGKGQTALTMNVPASVAAGKEFMIRFRYNIETNQGDRLPGENITFKVVLRGNITNISINPLPLVELNDQCLRPKEDYNLVFTAAGLSASGFMFVGREIIKSIALSDITSFKFQKNQSNAGYITNIDVNAAKFNMKIKSTVNSVNNTRCNLLDDKNLLFALVSAAVDTPFRSIEKCYHVAATFGNLSTVLPNTSLSSIVPGVNLPDLVTPDSKDVLRGTTYSFANITVTDVNGKIYKALNSDPINKPTELGTLLSIGTVQLGNSNPSVAVSRELAVDPQLGQITLHEILLGTYTFPVKNVGPKDAKNLFTNSFKCNMAAPDAPKLPEKAVLAPRTVFPNAPVIVNQNLPSLAAGIINNNIVHKASIQVYTFANRPGKFYCDNAWPLESVIEMTLDLNRTNDEVFETNNYQQY